MNYLQNKQKENTAWEWYKKVKVWGVDLGGITGKGQGESNKNIIY